MSDSTKPNYGHQIEQQQFDEAIKQPVYYAVLVEREACAQECDDIADILRDSGKEAEIKALRTAAFAIRARGANSRVFMRLKS